MNAVNKKCARCGSTKSAIFYYSPTGQWICANGPSCIRRVHALLKKGQTS